MKKNLLLIMISIISFNTFVFGINRLTSFHDNPIECVIIWGVACYATYCVAYKTYSLYQDFMLKQRTDAEVFNQANQYYQDLAIQGQKYLNILNKFDLSINEQERKKVKQELLKQIRLQYINDDYGLIIFVDQLLEERIMLKKHLVWLQERYEQIERDNQEENALSRAQALSEKIKEINYKIKLLIVLVKNLSQYQYEKLLREIKTNKCNNSHPIYTTQYIAR